MVTGTTFPRTDKWLCQKRARLDEVPEQMLVVGPLGTTKSKGVPGSLRFEERGIKIHCDSGNKVSQNEICTL